MTITAKCPNAECGKVLQVQEELAGKKVRCPSCEAVFVVPAPAAAVPVGAAATPGPSVAPSEPVAMMAEAAPAAPLGSGLTVPGMDQNTQIVLYVGLGLLGLLLLCVFLPWFSLLGFGASGIKYGAGIVMLLLVLAAGAGIAVTAFVLKKHVEPALAGGAAVGLYASLVFLILLIRFSPIAGFGMILGLLVALGVTGTLIYCSIRHPYSVAALKNTPPFVQKHGVLTAALAFAFVLGLIFGFVSLRGGSGFGMDRPTIHLGR